MGAMGNDEQRSLTRRGFLSSAAVGGAAIYLSACGSGSKTTGSSGAGGSGGSVTLNNLFQQQAGYSAEDLEGMTKAFEKQNPNIKVKNTLVAYEALHDKIVAAAPAGTYDVVLGDCIWPAEFGSKNIVKDLTSLVQGLPVNEIFPGAIQMALYKGKYYGMPWILDTKYMYANTAMLKKAGKTTADLKTLTGMVSTLEALKSKGVLKYPFMGSWKQAEAVVCDYATLVGAFGGKFLDSSGKPVFNTGGGVQALEFMKMLLDKGLANPSSTSSAEEEVLKACARRSPTTTPHPKNCRSRSRRRCSARPVRRARWTRPRRPSRRAPPSRRPAAAGKTPVTDASANVATAGALPARRSTRWLARTREARFAALLLVPSVIVVFGIVIYPVLRTLYTSFYAVNSPFPGNYPGVGFHNYTAALSNPGFWSAVERTAYFTFVSTALELLFGIGIALLLYAPLRMRWLCRTIVVVLVLRTIEAFKVFDIIYVMTGGGPANGTQSVSFYTYQRAFSDEYFGYGSALAYLIVLFILVLAALYIRALRSDNYGIG